MQTELTKDFRDLANGDNEFSVAADSDATNSVYGDINLSLCLRRPASVTVRLNRSRWVWLSISEFRDAYSVTYHVNHWGSEHMRFTDPREIPAQVRAMDYRPHHYRGELYGGRVLPFNYPTDPDVIFAEMTPGGTFEAHLEELTKLTTELYHAYIQWRATRWFIREA